MKDLLDGFYYANEVRMLRTSCRGISACLVEGGDDEKVYTAMFDLNACEVVVVQGWKNAVDALEILEKSHVPGILAIIDADSGYCDGRTPHSNNLFWTDNHDLEIDLLHSPAFERIVLEFCTHDDTGHPDTGHDIDAIKQIIFRAAAPLGFLRLHSQWSELNLTFKDLRYGNFINKETLEVDRVQMVRAVKNRSQRPDLDDQTLLTAVADIESKGHDLRAVCRGHDVTAIFALGLRKRFARRQSQEVPAERIEENLRSAFHQSHFQQTRLFAALRQWELRNTPYWLLRQSLTVGESSTAP